MIINAILNIVVSMFSFFTSFLPNVSELPLGLDNALQTAYAGFHAISRILPFLAIAMQYVLLGLVIELGYKTYQILLRFVNLMRGSG